MRKLLIGAAAVALAAGSAHAGPGHGGGGGGHGGQTAQMANHGHGNPNPGQGGGQSHGSGNEGGRPHVSPHADKAPHGPSMQGAHGPATKVEHAKTAHADRSIPPANQPRDMHPARAANVRAAGPVRPDNSPGPERFTAGTRGRDQGPHPSWTDTRRGLIEGCPPGLAKKNNGCIPPGLARQRDQAYRQAYYPPQWFGYDSLGDGRYFYDNGYLYRTGASGSVLGYLPLLGGALSVGNPWPSYYQPVSVPDYYVSYYNLGPANGYRYADDVLYRVDPSTDAITSIAALLTGDQFAVGQPMPPGYDVYNVPYGYQDRYVDGPDSYYRYADGYVYQVDPTTQLIQAAIQLLT